MRTLDQIVKDIEGALGDRLAGAQLRLGEITIEVKAADLAAAARVLRDHDSLRLGQLTDLFGLDYLEYGGGGWERSRFAVVYQLLSVERNFRLRLRAFCDDDDAPMLDSLVEVWPVANWYEREAFDLYGIMFAGHPDLRRILTDYGFVGHPFRKDFPVSGYVEMRFDPEQKRVVYQPVTVEVREVVPRVIRDESYGGAA